MGKIINKLDGFFTNDLHFLIEVRDKTQPPPPLPPPLPLALLRGPRSCAGIHGIYSILGSKSVLDMAACIGQGELGLRPLLDLEWLLYLMNQSCRPTSPVAE